MLLPPELHADLRGVLFVLCLVLAVVGWTGLLWRHVLGRSRPVPVGGLMKLLRRPN